MISKLRSEEKNKVVKLKPKRYIFCTSLSLSRDNKKKIKDIFKPFISSESDIFGNEDLNDFVDKYPRIEEKHYKLWIYSTTVLQRLLNNAIKGRSEFEFERICKQAYLYVETENHGYAFNKLEDKHVIIISGEPGIGKTKLAENLCLKYVSLGFEFIDIENSLNEAESLYSRGQKQIFYFDDFLGSNYFEAIQNKQDSHIIKFINRIASDKTKRFILTSRTNILNLGKTFSSVFSIQNIHNTEFLIIANKLTRFDKAQILYNHIWYSHLPESFIAELYKNKRYMTVIKHRNFNPRLIEFITDIDRISVESEYFWRYVEENLKNPKDIWKDCFKIQSNIFVRILVFLVVFNRKRISEVDLKDGFNKYIELAKIQKGNSISHDFDISIRLSTKSFLNRSKNLKNFEYTLFNPSIADYIINEYRSDFEVLAFIILSLQSLSCVLAIYDMVKNKLINKKNYSAILKKIFQEVFLTESKEYTDFDFLLALLNQMKDHFSIDPIIIVRTLNCIIENPKNIVLFDQFIHLIEQYSMDINMWNVDFIFTCSNQHVFTEDDLKCCYNIFKRAEYKSNEDYERFEEIVDNYFLNCVDEIMNEVQIEDFIEYREINSYFGEPIIDDEGIEGSIISEIEGRINCFDKEIIEKFDLSPDKYKEAIDIEKIVKDFVEGGESENHEGSFSSKSDFQDIEDLFDRN